MASFRKVVQSKIIKNRLLLSFLAMAGAVSVLFVTSVYRELFEPFSYVHWRTAIQKVNQGLEPAPKIILLGQSKLQRAVITGSLSIEAFSFGIPYLSIVDSYFFLKRYLEYNDAPKLLILSFDPHSFENVPYYGFNLKTAVETGLIDSHLFLELMQIGGLKWKWVQFGFYSLFNVISLPTHGLPVLPIRLWSVFLDSVQQYRSNYASSKGYVSAEEVSQFSKKFFPPYGVSKANPSSETWDKSRCEIMSDQFIYSEQNELYFRKIMAIAKKYSIKTMYVDLPMSKTCYNLTSPAYHNSYSTFIRSFLGTFDNLSIGSQMPKLLNDQHFSDSYHFSESGAELVTRKLRNMIHRKQ